jgi:Domain of unknown function (DUF4349)
MQRALTHRESSRRTRSAGSLTVLGALSALLLTGCNAGSASTGTMGRASSGAPAQGSVGADSVPGAKNSAPGAPPAPIAVTRPPQVSTSGAPVVGTGPRLTRTASLELQVKNIEAAAAQVQAVATALQAQVLNEQIGTGIPGPPVPLQSRSKTTTGFGTLTLSVPADTLDMALDQLGSVRCCSAPCPAKTSRPRTSTPRAV